MENKKEICTEQDCSGMHCMWMCINYNTLNSAFLQLYLHFTPISPSPSISFHWYKQQAHTQSCWFHVSLLDGVLGGQAKARLSHIFYITVVVCVENAQTPEHCPGKNTPLTSGRLSKHTANSVSKLSFWQEHEVICLCCMLYTSFLLSYLYSGSLVSCLQKSYFLFSFHDKPVLVLSDL